MTKQQRVVRIIGGIFIMLIAFWQFLFIIGIPISFIVSNQVVYELNWISDLLWHSSPIIFSTVIGISLLIFFVGVLFGLSLIFGVYWNFKKNPNKGK